MANHRILIVEDSPTMRQLLVFALKRLKGVEIVEAQDGMDGLRKVTSDDFSLALIDINMPVMGGFEMIREVRKLPQYEKTPIFILTTESTRNAALEGKTAGATAWIVKPFSPQLLLRGINKVLGG